METAHTSLSELVCHRKKGNKKKYIHHHDNPVKGECLCNELSGLLGFGFYHVLQSELDNELAKNDNQSIYTYSLYYCGALLKNIHLYALLEIIIYQYVLAIYFEKTKRSLFSP